ncbi:hypothetical protein [Mesorhizobium sp. SARCC-RB16n]|nr:hypothetical protein [Mesorhizobium sp. SARCC-RB16n]
MNRILDLMLERSTQGIKLAVRGFVPIKRTGARAPKKASSVEMASAEE